MEDPIPSPCSTSSGRKLTADDQQLEETEPSSTPPRLGSMSDLECQKYDEIVDEEKEEMEDQTMPVVAAAPVDGVSLGGIGMESTRTGAEHSASEQLTESDKKEIAARYEAATTIQVVLQDDSKARFLHQPDTAGGCRCTENYELNIIVDLGRLC